MCCSGRLPQSKRRPRRSCPRIANNSLPPFSRGRRRSAWRPTHRRKSGPSTVSVDWTVTAPEVVRDGLGTDLGNRLVVDHQNDERGREREVGGPSNQGADTRFDGGGRSLAGLEILQGVEKLRRQFSLGQGILELRRAADARLGFAAVAARERGFDVDAGGVKGASGCGTHPISSR